MLKDLSVAVYLISVVVPLRRRMFGCLSEYIFKAEVSPELSEYFGVGHHTFVLASAVIFSMSSQVDSNFGGSLSAMKRVQVVQ